MLNYEAKISKEFCQFDGFSDWRNVPDENGDCVFSKIATEEMTSATVRVLIPRGTIKRDAIRLLEKIKHSIKRYGFPESTDLQSYFYGVEDYVAMNFAAE